MRSGDQTGGTETGSPAQLQTALADRYAFERELGRGGMATVYLAHDLRHDRPVALKVLHPELAATLGPERFQREIRLAARLQHPHILTVHDSGEVPPGRRRSSGSPCRSSRASRCATGSGGSGSSRWRTRSGSPARRPQALAVRPRARRGPPRHQAREHPAHPRRQHAGGRLRDRAGAGRRRRRAADRDRPRGRHAGLHEPGAGRRRPRSSTPAPTSTRLARGALRDAGGRAAVHRRHDPGDHGEAVHRAAAERPRGPAERAGGGRAGDPQGARPGARPTGSPPPREFAQALGDGRRRRRADGDRRRRAAPAVARRRRADRRSPLRRRSSVLGFLLGLGVLFGWLRRHGGEPAPADIGRQASRGAPLREPRRARRRVLRRRRSPTRSAASSPRSPASRSPPAAARPSTRRARKDLRDDRAGAGGGLPAGGQGALGEGRRRAEPGAGEPGADPGGHRRRPSGSSRSTPRSPTCSRSRPTSRAGWRRRSTWRSARASSRRWRSGRPRTSRRTTPTSRARRSRASLSVSDPATLRRALDYYEQAVALDSSFVAAWAERARAYSLLYVNSVPEPALAEDGARVGGPGAGAGARAARGLSRARRVPPPESRRTARRALEQAQLGLKVAPAEREPARRGGAGRSRRWDAGRRQPSCSARREALDPRSVTTALAADAEPAVPPAL